MTKKTPVKEKAKKIVVDSSKRADQRKDERSYRKGYRSYRSYRIGSYRVGNSI